MFHLPSITVFFCLLLPELENGMRCWQPRLYRSSLGTADTSRYILKLDQRIPLRRNNAKKFHCAMVSYPKALIAPCLFFKTCLLMAHASSLPSCPACADFSQQTPVTVSISATAISPFTFLNPSLCGILGFFKGHMPSSHLQHQPIGTA